MSFKILLLCAQAFLMQSITAQYIGNAYAENAWNYPYANMAYEPNPIAYGPSPMAYPYGQAPYQYPGLAASNGGGLAVASSSPIAPVGVTMTSQNAIEGPLAVAGQIPFLGAVGVEGLLPTAGAGAISYGSGNGQVAILAEDMAGYGYPYSYGPSYAYGAYY